MERVKIKQHTRQSAKKIFVRIIQTGPPCVHFWEVAIQFSDLVFKWIRQQGGEGQIWRSLLIQENNRERRLQISESAPFQLVDCICVLFAHSSTVLSLLAPALGAFAYLLALPKHTGHICEHTKESSSGSRAAWMKRQLGRSHLPPNQSRQTSGSLIDSGRRGSWEKKMFDVMKFSEQYRACSILQWRTCQFLNQLECIISSSTKQALKKVGASWEREKERERGKGPLMKISAVNLLNCIVKLSNCDQL